jgi:hypothetical protein
MGSALQKRPANERSHPLAVRCTRDKSVPPRAIVGGKGAQPTTRYALLEDQQDANEIIEIQARQIQHWPIQHEQQVGNPGQNTRLREEVGNIVHRTGLTATRTELNQLMAERQHTVSTGHKVNRGLALCLGQKGYRDLVHRLGHIEVLQSASYGS